jgi:hypothetical protein
MLYNFIVNAQLKDWDPTKTGNGGCMVDGVPTLKCLEIVFGNILYMASAFIIFVLFIMIVIGAFQYLTSLGNAEKIKKAQGTIRMALIGFGLFVGSYLILKIIDVLFLGGAGKIFQFSIGG